MAVCVSFRKVGYAFTRFSYKLASASPTPYPVREPPESIIDILHGVIYSTLDGSFVSLVT